MSNRPYAMIDTLESRTLLSVAPTAWTPPTLGPKALADIKAIQADFKQIGVDAKAAQPLISADLKALQTAIANAANSKAVLALKAKLAADVKSAAPKIQADLTAIANVYKTDGALIYKDWLAVRAAGSDATKLAAAKLKLAADEKKFTTDLAAAQAKLKADRAPILADEKAVQAAINADPAVVAAKKKLATDDAKLTADYTKLAADEKQLATDIKNHA